MDGRWVSHIVSPRTGLPVDPWGSGAPRPAHTFGFDCPQPPGATSRAPGQSEDCLTLNVWAPADADGSNQGSGAPVLVWFYGGSFLFGSGSDPVCDGTNLARRGAALAKQDRDRDVSSFAGVGALVVVVSLLYFAANAFTKGYYRGRLRLMALAATLLGTAAVAAAFYGTPTQARPAGSEQTAANER